MATSWVSIHQGNGLNNLRTSSPVLKTSVRRPSSDKARHIRPPAFMVRIATEASVHVPVLRPVDGRPRRNRLSRFALTLWRAGPRFDRRDGHLHCNGHPEDECEPRSGCHVRLLMPAFLVSRSDWRRRLATTQRQMGVAKGFSGKIFILPNPWADPRRHISR